MSIKIDSTTDSDTDVKSALGNQTRLEGKAPTETKVTEGEPAAVEKPAEQAAASGTAEGEGEKSPEPGKVEGKEPGKNLDKRFAKLTRQRKEAEAKAEYWETEAKRVRDSMPKPEPKVEPEVNAKPSGEPKADDFDTYQEYVDAKVDWKFKQADVERERKASEQSAKSYADNLWKQYAEKEKAFMKEKPDLQERVDAIKDMGIKMSPIVEDRIIRTGPDLAYELMKDPEEFKALCAMDANDALEHIGVVKAQMKASGTTAKPKDEKIVEIKQPKPVQPVGSRATVIKDPEKMSLKEYDAWRRAGNSPSA